MINPNKGSVDSEPRIVRYSVDRCFVVRPRVERAAPSQVRAFSGRFAVLSIVLAALACAAPPLAISPGEVPTLADDEGLLVVHVDTALGLDRLSAGLLEVTRGLPAGEHIWVVPAKAGAYRWSGIRFTVHDQDARTLRPELRLDARTGMPTPLYLDERPIHQSDTDVINSPRTKRGRGYLSAPGPDEFAFEVRAGAINYPGHLLIELANEESGIAGGVFVRNRNHAAQGMRKIARGHAALVDAYPLRFAGLVPDEFLELYSREREKLRGRRAAAAGRSGGGR